MTSKVREPIPQHVIILILVGMIMASEVISSVLWRSLPISKPFADGVGFFTVSLLIYWLPQFRGRRRISLVPWIGISLIVGAVAGALFLLIDAAYAQLF